MQNYYKTDIEIDEPKPLLRVTVFLIIVFIIFINIKNRMSFDDTVLKVDMKPFSTPAQTIPDKNTPKAIFVEANGAKAHLIPLAEYKIYGRVYTKHYVPIKMDLGTVMPYDMAIGWNRMADKDVFKMLKMKYALADRVVYWQYKAGTPLSYYEINSSFSNNHLIPANKKVRKGLDKIKVKDVIYLEGYLVKLTIFRPDGRDERVVSSLYRDDEGLGACEVIYVKRVVSRHGDFS